MNSETGSDYEPSGHESTASDHPTDDVDRGRGVATDGGIPPSTSSSTTCPHPRARRYGRTNDQGEPVVEVRCIDCGRTLSVGGVRR